MIGVRYGFFRYDEIFKTCLCGKKNHNNLSTEPYSFFTRRRRRNARISVFDSSGLRFRCVTRDSWHPWKRVCACVTLTTSRTLWPLRTMTSRDVLLRFLWHDFRRATGVCTLADAADRVGVGTRRVLYHTVMDVRGRNRTVYTVERCSDTFYIIG